MEKIWLKRYPEHAPEFIGTERFSSLLDMFQQSVKKYADKPAAKGMGITLTYKELDERSTAFAAYLQSQGLVKGDKLALMMPNMVQYLIALYGGIKAGLIIVNFNPMYTARELEYQLKDSQAKAIVVLENFAHTLAGVLPNTPLLEKVIITRLFDQHPCPKSCMMNFMMKRVKKMIPAYSIPNAVFFSKALKQGRKVNYQPVELIGDDLAFLQYTGGTTGVAKGAMLSHRNVTCNAVQAHSWIANKLRDGEERVAVLLPLYHIFSLMANALVFMYCGGCCVMIANPRDVPGLINEFEKHRFTVVMAVNTLLNTLANREAFQKLDFSELRLVIAGGMALQSATAKKWREVTGQTAYQGYGLTECSPITCINPEDEVEFNGSIGLPMTATEAMIIDDNENELPPGELGELCFRGPQVMQGYWNRPEESAKVFFGDGWIKTGDIAKMSDEGFITLVDRKKDMILVAGFNVFPNEVEEVISSHPDVVEVAVVGIPNRVTGEMVKAFVVSSNPDFGKAELITHCRKGLVGYKIPKKVEFCEELPKNAVGKILRRELRSRTK
jgi:long-chain acyl-CoA synthetase